MRKHKSLRVITFLIVSVFVNILPTVSMAGEVSDVQRLMDVNAINNLLARYMRAYDTRNVALYETLFTEDAVVDSSGTLFNGRQEIRQIVINLAQALVAAKDNGSPVWPYHILSNSEIISIDEDEAYHEAYWTVPVFDAEGKINIGVMGTYEDRLVRQANGEWLISSRKIRALGPSRD